MRAHQTAPQDWNDTKMKKLLLIFICLTTICSCAPAVVIHKPVYYDSEGNTGVIVNCKAHHGQITPAYVIKVDDWEDIMVEGNRTEITIYLWPGTHILRISSLSALSKCEGGRRCLFGKPAEREFNLYQNEFKEVVYTSPFSLFQKGSIEFIERK